MGSRPEPKNLFSAVPVGLQQCLRCTIRTHCCMIRDSLHPMVVIRLLFIDIDPAVFTASKTITLWRYIFMSDKRSKTSWSVYTIVMMGMLIAMEIILERTIAIPIGNINRVSLGKCVVILAGLWMGPVCGAIVGMISDVIGAILAGYTIIPLITLSSMMWGIIPVLFLPMIKKSDKSQRVLLLCMAIIINSVVSTLVLTSLGLMQFYGTPLSAMAAPRSIQFITLTPVYCIVVSLLYFSPLTRMATEMNAK